MLVKFSCDCIGFAPHKPGVTWLVSACDSESREVTFFERDFMEEKSFAPLDPDREVTMLRELGALVSDGYAFRQVQSLLAPRD